MGKNLRRSLTTWLCLAFAGALCLAPTRAAAQATSCPPPNTAQTCTQRVSTWTYDANTGLMTSETAQAESNATSVTTTYTYDAYGNKTAATVTATGITTRTTTTTYDSQGQFATKVTNALGQSESWTYNASFGVPATHTGPNGLTTSWLYDSLGRKTFEIRADGTTTSWVFGYCSYIVTGQSVCPGQNAFEAPTAAFRVETFVYASNNGQPITTATGMSVNAAPPSQTIYDTLGRVIQTGQEMPPSGAWAVENTVYNALGQVASTDKTPVFGADNFTTFVYDALGRITSVTSPYQYKTDTTSGSAPANGTVTVSYGYNGLVTSVTDPNQNTTYTTLNDIGKPAYLKVVTPGAPALTPGTNGYAAVAQSITSYSYDPLGNLLTITDPSNNVTSFTYDAEGRKTKMTDPDRGVWSYSYDPLGELTSQTDANGNQTTFVYDVLGRMVTRTYAHEVDSWNYDSAAFGIGKLASESELNYQNGTNFVRQQLYDHLGRPTMSCAYPAGVTAPCVAGAGTACNASSVVCSTLSYDPNLGLPSTFTYASGFTIGYNYTLGTLTSIFADTNPGGGGPLLWSLNTANAAGQITQETLGNGAVVNNSYDSATGHLFSTTAAINGTQIANFVYNYDAVGNLATRTDNAAAATPLTENLTYDALYRLTNSAAGNNPAVAVTYDALGDITSKSDTGVYAYNYAGHAHAVATITCTGSAVATSCGGAYNVNALHYAYDANGNQTQGDGYTATWSPFNMATQITKGAYIVSYDYDADHNRVVQNETQSGHPVGRTNYYTDPNTGLRSEAVTNAANAVTWTDYLQAGGEAIGIHVTPPAPNAGGSCAGAAASCNLYFIRDHLGSVAIVTGDAGCSFTATANNSASCIVERDSFDPWGRKRNASTWAELPIAPTSANTVTTRGYTGHEDVNDINLVNMNARFYDPTTGRFMSPDPIINTEGGLQALNPYSYVLNNPLSATDPTGMCGGLFGFIVCPIKHIFHSIGVFLRHNQLIGDVIVIASAIACAPYAASAACAAGASAQISFFETGRIAPALEAGAITYGTTVAFNAVGGEFDPGADGTSAFENAVVSNGIGNAAEAQVANYIGDIAADGVVGGLSSLAQGGSFESGFLAAGFSSAVAPFSTINGTTTEDTIINTASQSVTGGFGSMIGGGSFENGAVTGAFRYLYNSCGAGCGGGPHGNDPFGNFLGQVEGDVWGDIKGVADYLEPGLTTGVMSAGMPTISKPGGIAGGGVSGPATSALSQPLRDIFPQRVDILRSLGFGTNSLGGAIGRGIPYFGVFHIILDGVEMNREEQEYQKLCPGVGPCA